MADFAGGHAFPDFLREPVFAVGADAGGAELDHFIGRKARAAFTAKKCRLGGERGGGGSRFREGRPTVHAAVPNQRRGLDISPGDEVLERRFIERADLLAIGGIIPVHRRAPWSAPGWKFHLTTSAGRVAIRGAG